MNTLRKDLQRQIRHTLHKWAVESVDLYKIAGLGPHEMYGDVLEELLRMIVSAAVILRVPQDEFLAELGDYMNEYRKARSKTRESRQ